MTNGGLIGIRSGIPSSLFGRWSVDDYRQFLINRPPTYTAIDQVATPFLWIDPSNTSSITHSANNVTQINDLTGNGRHATQANTTHSPTTNTDTINGLNTLRFNGTKALTLAAPPTAGVLFVVFSSENATALRYLMYHTRPSDDIPGPIAVYQNVRLSTLVFDVVNAYSAYQFSTAFSVGPKLLTYSYGPDGMMCRLNKQLVGYFPYAVPAHSNTVFLGGTTATGTSGWDGKLGELVYFSSQSIDVIEIENLLAAKWGIS
jgi:hypothetical protein